MYRYFSDASITDDDFLLSLDGPTDLVQVEPQSQPMRLPSTVLDATSRYTETSTAHLGIEPEIRSNHQAIQALSPVLPVEQALVGRGGIALRDLWSPLGGDSPPGISADVTDDSTYQLPFSLGLALSRRPSQSELSFHDEPQFPIDESLSFTLLDLFIHETATWCETTDSARHMSVTFAHELSNHPIGKAAAFALASRQLSIFDSRYEETSLRLYQHTIRMLIQQDPDGVDSFVLAACVLLCVYEMIASRVGDWRRHLKVCRPV